MRMMPLKQVNFEMAGQADHILHDSAFPRRRTLNEIHMRCGLFQFP